ncbi:threonylcarbamoyl-AMP synthase [Gemella sp. 19428wG2_WT2a]|nr:threonylcarbamoyl-AMP synthase [Gemella sp. 19428wG2_WT2a]TFU60190.1 threonylcarbamoyl-AMP synthase [Gemella sp. WT2a]
MKTEIIRREFFNKNSLKKIKEYYISGKVVAIPTETVYGLSADAQNEKAVSKIFEAKNRPVDNPLIVHFYELNQLNGIVDYSDPWVGLLANKFWPGPMSLILPLVNKERIAANVTAGLTSLAVRMPSDKYARRILEETRLLLAAPSANTSGKPSPTRADHVINDMDEKIEAIVEGDDSEIGLESTVIDCRQRPFVIARPGSISLNDIEAVLGKGNIFYHDFNHREKIISPGTKYRHYSPDADLLIEDTSFDNMLQILKNTDEKTLFITYKNKESDVKNLPCKIKYLAKNEENIEESSKNLYNILRECDLENIKTIYILKIKENDKTKALVNRLTKASSKM